MLEIKWLMPMCIDKRRKEPLRTIAFYQDLIYSLRMDVCHTVSLFKCLDKTSHQIHALWSFKHYIKSSALSLSQFLTCTDRWPSQGPPILSIHLNFDIFTFGFKLFFTIFPWPLSLSSPFHATPPFLLKKKNPYLSRAGDKSWESVAVQHFSLLISGIY